jgi:hypothetical protein
MSTILESFKVIVKKISFVMNVQSESELALEGAVLNELFGKMDQAPIW